MGQELTKAAVAKVTRRLDVRVEGQAKASILAAAMVYEGQLKVELSQPGTGRTYIRRGVVHQASAPGEPPAVDTGRLRGSVHTSATGNEGAVRVGVIAPYAAALEFGAPERSLLPRPYLRPALAKCTDAMIAAAKAADVREARIPQAPIITGVLDG